MLLNNPNIDKTKNVGFYIKSNQGNFLKELSDKIFLVLNIYGGYDNSINMKDLKNKQHIHQTNVISKHLNPTLMFEILVIQLLLSNKDIECICQTNYPDMVYIGTDDTPFDSMNNENFYDYKFGKKQLN